MCRYKLKSITVSDGEVRLNVLESGSRSRDWFQGIIEHAEGQSVFKQLCQTGRMLYDGQLQFAKSSECKAKRVYDSCKRRHGTWRKHYHDKDEKKYRERFASEFARRMCA